MKRNEKGKEGGESSLESQYVHEGKRKTDDRT